MYPVDPKPPSRQLACLPNIQDIDDVQKQIVSGYCIKAMASDPYGHPVFAVTDAKVGSILVYDAEKQQVLRKIGAGYHEVDSVTFDSDSNFIMTTDKQGEHAIVKYNLKGEHIYKLELEDVTRIYGVAVTKDSNVAASLLLTTNENVVRVYNTVSTQPMTTINKDSVGKPYFIKPQYIVPTGDKLVVADVGTKNIRCFTSEGETSKIVWTYAMEMPRGMCVDGGGNICACDFRNNRVTLLTPNGELIGHSFTGLSKPQYIAMNHNKLFTIDMGRSTSYRLSVHSLHKTPKSKRHSKNKPEWQ